MIKQLLITITLFALNNELAKQKVEKRNVKKITKLENAINALNEAKTTIKTIVSYAKLFGINEKFLLLNLHKLIVAKNNAMSASTKEAYKKQALENYDVWGDIGQGVSDEHRQSVLDVEVASTATKAVTDPVGFAGDVAAGAAAVGKFVAKATVEGAKAAFNGAKKLGQEAAALATQAWEDTKVFAAQTYNTVSQKIDEGLAATKQFADNTVKLAEKVGKDIDEGTKEFREAVASEVAVAKDVVETLNMRQQQQHTQKRKIQEKSEHKSLKPLKLSLKKLQ